MRALADPLPAAAGRQGRLYFWGERALYLGRGLPATVHTHHAIQICIPLSGSVRLRTGPGAHWREYGAAVIPANQPHESDLAVDLIATLWVEPSRADTPRRWAPPGSRSPIVSVQTAKLAPVAERLAACWRESWDSQRAATLTKEIVRLVALDRPGRELHDPRVARALEILDSAPERRVKLAEVAAGVHLSPSRLAHLLSAEIRMPARRYLLWLRLRDALQALARGVSITTAAHAAGFADAPHLDRTFRRMLGFTPSAALRVSKFVQDTVTEPR